MGTFLVVVVFSILAGLVPHSVFAEELQGKAILVLDASGSMWGQIEGKHKIDIAKEVVHSTIEDWDERLGFGLTVYGHRRKGDCSDIESIIPVGSLDKGKTVAALGKITPRGKTPLSDAVVQAAEELKFEEERATVILVSDGIETCEKDPCVVSKKLEQSGVDFTVHVIGFDVTKAEEKKQLKCFADNTGGKFISAKDAASLQSALGEAVEEVVQSIGGLRFYAVSKKGGEALPDIFEWRVLRSSDGSVVHEKKTRQLHSEFLPGSYRVTISKGELRGSRDVEIKAGGPKRYEILVNMGQVRLSAVNKSGEKALSDVSWTIFQVDSLGEARQKKFTGRDEPSVNLFPGEYSATVRKGKAEATAKFSIEAGVEKVVEVVLGQGEVKFHAVDSLGAEPLSADWSVYREDELGKRSTITSTGADQPTFTLPPGEYMIQVRKGKATAEQKFTVEGGQKKLIEVILAKGEVKFKAVDSPGAAPLSADWKVYLEDELGKRSTVTSTGADQPTFTLPPGEYWIQARKGKAKAERTFTVEAGKKEVIEVVLAQGEVKFHAVDSLGGPPLAADWLVYQQDELEKRTQIASTGADQPIFTLTPGEYWIQARKGKAKAEQTFTVEAGKKELIEVILAKGDVKLRLVEAAGGKALPVTWQIYQKSEQGDRARVAGTGADEPILSLAPGHYTAEARFRDHRVEKDFEVEKGTKKIVEVVLSSEE